jgi:hypothetical protein|eukprot:g4775.t1
MFEFNVPLLASFSPLTVLAIGVTVCVVLPVLRIAEELSRHPKHLEPKPGPFWKVVVGYALIQCSQLVRPRKSQLKDRKWLDSRHFENTEDECSNDSFYWWANSKPGAKHRVCVTSRLGFHGVGGKKTTPWLVFDIDGRTFGLAEEFVRDSTPDATNPETVVALDESGNYLKYTCESPMKRWRLQYDGPVTELSAKGGEKAQRPFRATMDLNVEVIEPAFYYQQDWDPLTIAKAMSTKPWSLQFFRGLRSEHQEHYEMGTTVTGTFEVKGEGRRGETIAAELSDAPGMRDHSFGKRDWTIMVRYIWLGTISFDSPLEINGSLYTHMTGTAVHYGTSFKHMVAGGLMGKDAKRTIPFTGMTHMKDVAGKWYDNGGKVGIGHLIEDDLQMTISIQGSPDCIVLDAQRDSWKHGFLMQGDKFEVHEGTALYTVTHGKQSVRGHGLLEFGGVVRDNAKGT